MGSPQWLTPLGSALDAVRSTGPPRPIWQVAAQLGAEDPDQNEVVRHLNSSQINDALRTKLHMALASWDAADAEGWKPREESTPRTPERRSSVYRRLQFDDTLADTCDQLFPVFTGHTTVISKTFEPWYDEARSQKSSMYWDHYERYLVGRRGWPVESVQTLDLSSTEIVERLSDPCRPEAKQTRGLVVGYVQSGKTANFTGVAAKALDAGYRLIIILTGTVELLRSQTQRRLDMELVGRENIIAGQDLDNPQVLKELDYQQDEDWIAGGFIAHGEALEQGHAPRIRRVTTHQGDYKTLPQGLTQLRYARRNRQARLNDPENLFSTDAYLAIVKKNPAPLRKLIKDLKPLKGELDDLPVLIIDDESDQASVDTTNPNKSKGKARKRTTINGLISQLMVLCKRAQYVGYTATPFANVFIDPDDDTDLFPADFLLSLPQPPGYMGVQRFHDIGKRWYDEEKTVTTSNELAHVRTLTGTYEQDTAQRDRELKQALEAYVLSGAIKMYRENHGERRFRHHTMLVHESMYTAAHTDTAQAVRRLWQEAHFTSGTGLASLSSLYENDFAPVSAARAHGELIPPDFQTLKPYVASALAQITIDNDPVIVVNSDKELNANQKKLDFQADPVWRILVGGTQLSRGFTVEGLTISYFRRHALQGDTLMQAGRWFGFRPGYEDLVRLYIRRDDRVDLYEAFEALLLDEEAFREELKQYSGFEEDGMPVLEPRQIPPLVSQHLPWLRPTARTKMWNAVIEQKATAMGPRDFYGVPLRGSTDMRGNALDVGAPLIHAADREQVLTWRRTESGISSSGPFHAALGILDAATVLGLLSHLKWHPDYADTINPTLAFIEAATAKGDITEWVVVWPQLQSVHATTELGGVTAQVVRRSRRGNGRIDFVGSDRKHSSVLSDVAQGRQGDLPSSTTRGAILLYLADDRESESPSQRPPRADRDEVAVLLTLYLSHASTPTRKDLIRWTVRSPVSAQAVAVAPET